MFSSLFKNSWMNFNVWVAEDIDIDLVNIALVESVVGLIVVNHYFCAVSTLTVNTHTY